MFDVGSKELIIISVVLILLFGSQKLIELSRGLGESIKIIRRSFKENLQSDQYMASEVADKKQ